MNKTVRWIVRTAVLLALTLVAQSIRSFIPIPKPIDQFIIGSLVNLCLIIAGVIVGFEGGLAIAILTPIIAFAQGALPLPIMIPVIAFGNVVLVTAIAFNFDKNAYIAVITGAMLKFLSLYFLVVRMIVPLFIAKLTNGVQLSKVLSLNFSWPQLVTALIGGAIAILILPLIKKALNYNAK